MDAGRVNVAVIRGERRRGAVSQALALLADDLRPRVTPHVLITPEIAASRKPNASTHPDTLSAVFDFLRAFGARQISVGAAPGGVHAFETLRYRREAFGRPVQFVALDDEGGIVSSEDHCSSTGATAGRLEPPACCVSLTLAQSFGSSAQRLRSQLSIVDAFDARSRLVRGGRFLFPLRTIVAGTDPVAVDAVAAVVLGIDPQSVGHLRAAQDAGLGVADLGRITVVGDPIERRKKRAGSRDRATSPAPPAPHLRIAAEGETASESMSVGRGASTECSS